MGKVVVTLGDISITLVVSIKW